ncbi:MAG: glutathionylspermidine synthase family protein, partial [Bacillota bacterium]|nr:glutathionylspermidine synthase family protein [Bacillota bacterium]
MNRINQRQLTEEMLFDYYMISSRRQDDVFSQIPYYLERNEYKKLRNCAEILDSLVMKIMLGINAEHSAFKDYMDDFPFKEEILSSKREVKPIFWTRYDGFLRDGGGIFFSEFNYDKPCAQREILYSEAAEVGDNPNTGFKEKFISQFHNVINENFPAEGRINAAVLIDPCHYEEHHLAHLFTDLLQNDKVAIIAAGPKNFFVRDETVFAFDKKIDVILRLFPTEFLYEVNDMDKILQLYDRNRVLLINDPRVIVCQAKSMFAYLWRLLEDSPEMLTDEESYAIRESLPHTVLLSKDMLPGLIDNKDKYVIKAVFGRYSSEVYIGSLYTQEEWQGVLEHVLKSPKLHVLQQFCKIKPDISYKAAGQGKYPPFESFGNFGIFMFHGSYAGICIRWSEDYLTDDCTTWITPVGITDKPFYVEKLADGRQRRLKWKDIYEKAAFQYGFTGGYTGRWEAFSIEPIMMKADIISEIENASNAICSILRRVQQLVLDNSDIFFPLLSIDEGLIELIKQKYTDVLCAVGRMDWVITQDGKLKLLEFNSETPAGIVEGIALSSLIKEELAFPYENPCSELADKIKENLYGIIREYESVKEIKTVGFLTSTYYEDWYTTLALYELLKDLPYEFIIGNIHDVVIKEGALYLYGKKLDCVYRYYPLDWFCEEDMKGFIDAFGKASLSLNPPHTLITQNKGLFVVLYELLDQGYFN